MGRAGRPPKQSARADIVRATLELIAEFGLSGATIDAIADRAEIARATIYRRWSSKEDLIIDAVKELTAAGELESGSQEPVTEMRGWLLAQAQAIKRSLSDPIVASVIPALVGELPHNPRLAQAWAERVVRPRQEVLRAHLRWAIDRGLVRRSANPDLVADLLLAPFFFHVVSPFGHPTLGAHYPEELVAIIWEGIAPE